MTTSEKLDLIKALMGFIVSEQFDLTSPRNETYSEAHKLLIRLLTEV